MDQNKGILINIVNTVAGETDMKGRTKNTFTIEPGVAAELIVELQANIAKGFKTKLDFRTEMKRNSQTGTTFPASFALVKEVVPKELADQLATSGGPEVASTGGPTTGVAAAADRIAASVKG